MQRDLFDTGSPQHWSPDKKSHLTLHTEVFSKSDAVHYFSCLTQSVKWQQSEIRIAGKMIKIPRLNAWYGDPEAKYQYSGTWFEPIPWTKDLAKICSYLEQLTHFKFNSCLANLYRDGNDSVAWHADNEPQLGKNPAIASVSFGETRRFQLKHRTDKSIARLDLDLPDNSLLLMSGELQHHWIHQVPKTRKPCSARLNLTFRHVFPTE